MVTAALAPALVERLIQRAAGRGRASLVYVDPSSFSRTAPPGAPRNPALLRLAAAGVPVAVVRQGEDLSAALSAPSWGSVASG